MLWREMPQTPDKVPIEVRTPIEWTVIARGDCPAANFVAAALRNHGCATELKTVGAQCGVTAVSSVVAMEIDGETTARKVVDECEVLIAVWNPSQSPQNAPIERSIRDALELGRLVICVDPISEESSPKIVHLNKSISHQGKGKTARLPSSEETQLLFHMSPLPQRGKSISVGFHQLSSYNRDAAWNRTVDEQIRQRTLQRWLNGATEARLPDRWLRNFADCFVPYYARADQLAIRYQQLYVFAATWLFFLSAIAVTVAVFQNLMFPRVSSLTVVEISCMLAILVLLGISQQGAYHAKWLNDRLLAEHLRIAFFCAIAGIRDTAGEARLVSHLPFYRKADDWVFHVVDRLIQACPASPAVEPEQSEHLPALKQFLLTTWIQDQADWHASNARRKHHASHRAHRLGAGLFTATLLLAVLHLLGVGHPSGHEAAPHPGGFNWTIVGTLIASLAIVLPAWGAAVHAIDTLLERERIAERSAQMATILKEVGRRLERTTDLPSLQAEVRRARDVILAENQEWLASLRFRPPVLPA